MHLTLNPNYPTDKVKSILKNNFKMIKKISILIVLFSSLTICSQTALEIIQKSDAKLRGESSYSEMTVTIVRPKWQKTMTMKSWSLGTDYSVSLVTSPAKEKGSVFKEKK